MFARLIAASAVAFASSVSLAAVSVTQTISFDSIAPFGTYTEGEFVASGWTLGGNPIAFPFAKASDIETIEVEFASNDRYYLAEVGPAYPGQPAGTHPNGGIPSVEFNVLNPDRVGVVSFNKANADATLFEYGDAQDRFGITTRLLADQANSGANPGNLGVKLGGFVNWLDDVTNNSAATGDFTFGGTSTLTITVNGTPTPEPASLAALGLASTMLRRRR